MFAYEWYIKHGINPNNKVKLIKLCCRAECVVVRRWKRWLIWLKYVKLIIWEKHIIEDARAAGYPTFLGPKNKSMFDSKYMSKIYPE